MGMANEMETSHQVEENQTMDIITQRSWPNNKKGYTMWKFIRPTRLLCIHTIDTDNDSDEHI